MPLVPALPRQKQADLCEFRAVLVYVVTEQLWLPLHPGGEEEGGGGRGGGGGRRRQRQENRQIDDSHEAAAEANPF